MATTDFSRPRGFWGAAPSRFFVMFLALVLAYAGGQITLLAISAHAPVSMRS